MAAGDARVPGGKGLLGGKLTDLKQRLLFVVGALVVFRIGTHIPVPGIDPVALAEMFKQTQGSIVDLFNMFSGGALERFSVLALGVMPYISASIIMQLMTTVVPSLEQLKKEGESGRRKITQYTRYGTVVLAIFQGLGIAIALEGQRAGGVPVVIEPGVGFKLVTVVTLVTGTMFIVWLGEQVTERGIGNGISLIIFAGIVAGLPSAIGGTLELARTGAFQLPFVAALFLVAIAVTGFVVFMERGQRRITVNYAKRQMGRQMYAAQTSHLPFKINMAGVIPPIFASSLILFPATLGSWFGQSESMGWLKDFATTLSPGQPIYVMVYAGAIIFFCFFLYGVDVQSEGNGRKPEKVRRLCAGNSSGRADRQIHRRRDVAVDPGRRPVRHPGLFAAGVSDREVECAILFWRHVPADYCRREHGLHGTDTVAPDVASV